MKDCNKLSGTVPDENTHLERIPPSLIRYSATPLRAQVLLLDQKTQNVLARMEYST